MTAAVPKPKVQLQDKPEEKANSQETVRVEKKPATSDAASATQVAQSLASAAPSTQISQGPVILSSKLSVICPDLTAPSYPLQSRQFGEHGDLMLELELNENGKVEVAKVISSSGYKRLDEAAIAAVKTWRCNPPLRNGQPVRAIALQPFSFALE